MLSYEIDNCTGYKLIAGIDEAGRGPLAGPVAVAIAVMPMDDIIEGVNDSKKLSAKKRDELYEQIVAKAIDYSVQLVDEKTIDKINILQATKLGMQNCIKSLQITPDLILIDAVKLDTKIKSISIIHGDALSYNIACASILAKVTRDRLMDEYDLKYPEYGFKKHKGYGTKAHIEALKKYGKCPIHRDTFIGHFV
ncbi:MAG: ribonuclease HII [Clostridia bacterium]|nr:ribonuclease HII [Clostridia bacterium]